MTDEPAKIAALLAREYPFHNLSSEQLLELAAKFKTRSFQENDVLSGPKQLINKYYIVYAGTLQMNTALDHGKYRITTLKPGDYFGDEHLLGGKAPTMTVTALESGSVIYLESQDFESILDMYPETRQAIQMTMQSRRLALSKRFSWLSPEESVFFISRKHVFFLIRGLIIPILMVIASLPLLAIGATGNNIVTIFGVLLLAGGSILFLWKWLDWGNDYYVVTSQRTVWIEKILLLYDSRDEAPLYNILAVDVFQRWFDRVIGYGDVSVRTFTGRIMMRHTSHPFVLAAYVNGLRARSAQIFKELEEKQMEDALAAALQKRQAQSAIDLIQPIPRSLPQMPVKKVKEKKQGGMRAWWRDFLKVRYEQDGVITYRKAWPILVWKTWIPFLLLIVWLFGVVFFIGFDFSLSETLLGSLGLMVAFTGLIFWLWYGYTDWRNDIYRLTPTQIFDIEKKPIGAELSKSADIENILTVTHERGFLGILLNFGNVTITVGETRFIFLHVYNPDRVHQDVANYQEALRQLRRKAEEARERERMINWLVAYHLESKK